MSVVDSFFGAFASRRFGARFWALLSALTLIASMLSIFPVAAPAAGLEEDGDLGNFVWLDDGDGNPALAGNGIQDAGEPGIDGLTVNLWRQGVILDTTITAGGGFYYFTGVETLNQYRIEVERPALHVYPQHNAGTDDTVDSDALVSGAAEGFTRKFSFPPVTEDIDVGFFACPLEATGAQILVEFDDERLIDTAAKEKTQSYSVDIPAGSYEVTLVGADFYENHTDQNQIFEQYFLHLFSGESATTYDTGVTDDIPESEALNWIADEVNGPSNLLVLTEDVDELQAWHISTVIGGQPTANSVDPICALFHPVAVDASISVDKEVDADQDANTGGAYSGPKDQPPTEAQQAGHGPLY